MIELDAYWLSQQKKQPAAPPFVQTRMVFDRPKDEPKRAFIFAAGEYKAEDISYFHNIKWNDKDLIICADGGYDVVKTIGLTPHIIIGDMDSICSQPPDSVRLEIHPKEKDKTDLALCIDYALKMKCQELFLLGAFGGRIDHSLAALFAMRSIVERGANCMLLNRRSRVYLVRDRLVLDRGNFQTVSLIPLTDTVEGVTTTNLCYPLVDATLRQESSLGISNEFAAEKAEVTIRKGLLFVICEE